MDPLVQELCGNFAATHLKINIGLFGPDSVGFFVAASTSSTFTYILSCIVVGRLVGICHAFAHTDQHTTANHFARSSPRCNASVYGGPRTAYGEMWNPIFHYLMVRLLLLLFLLDINDLFDCLFGNRCVRCQLLVRVPGKKTTRQAVRQLF